MRRNTLESIMQSVAVCEHGLSCETCCWLWTGQVATKGYGKVSYNNQKRIAHSLIFDLYSPPLPHERLMHHLHTCDVPLCCNWHHIYRGTHQRNMIDKVERSRQCRGETQPQAKLSDAKVYQIRRNRYCGWEVYELAYFFDVSIAIIYRILARQDWKHLRGELIRSRA